MRGSCLGSRERMAAAPAAAFVVEVVLVLLFRRYPDGKHHEVALHIM